MITPILPQQAGLIYLLFAIPVITWLWYTNRFTLPKKIAILILSTALGFLAFSPMAPYQFQQVLLGEIRQLAINPLIVYIVLILLVLVVFLIGRVFCGTLCPVGAIQEIVYHLPGPKLKIPFKRITIGIHAIIAGIIIFVSIFYGYCVLRCFGIRDFYHLDTSSIWFILFIILIMISVFIYRPFCRFICPYGIFFIPAAFLSYFKLRRTDTCIECHKCEKVCPVQEAERTSGKAECYLCGRCTDVCPVKGALIYEKRTNK